MTYRVPATSAVYAFSPDNKPVLTVPSGTTVELETCDCFGDQLISADDTLAALDWDRINPATGPVYVEGAVRGGALRVTIESIEVHRQGVMATGEDLGVLGDRFTGLTHKMIPFVDGKAQWDEGVLLPMSPMIGVIGVAPAEGSINCGTPGSHGGNMDNVMVAEGATLYLPVSVDGALFGCGDFHAVMGDGEVCGTGVECPGVVRLTLEAVPDLPITDPLLETADLFSTIASAETLDEAVNRATTTMAEMLAERISLPLNEIIMLMSAVGDARICQVVDPLKTARFVMPKSVLAAYGFEL